MRRRWGAGTAAERRAGTGGVSPSQAGRDGNRRCPLVTPQAAGEAPEQRRSVASGPPSRGPVAEGGSRCAGGRWVPAYLLVFRRSAPDGAEHGTGDPAMGLGGHCPSSSLSGPPPCEQGRLPTVSVGGSEKRMAPEQPLPVPGRVWQARGPRASHLPYKYSLEMCCLCQMCQ